MFISLTVFSILAISALVWLANKFLPFVVCPICAGVFLTWVGLLGAHFAGYQIDLVIPALLMGGSVVGITYQLEKRSAKLSANTLLLWKVLFIPTGFVSVYALLEQLWAVFFSAIVFLLLLSFVPLASPPKAGPPSAENDKVGLQKEADDDIEKKMKDCC